MTPKKESEPHDRLTFICNDMIKAFDTSGWSHGGEKVIVFVSDDRTHRSGIGIQGFESEEEAIPYVLLHLRAMCEASGKILNVYTGKLPIGHD